ncbi:MAG: 50S ribosomal protein L11 methyltransferase [Bacteroidota bacterium]|nr:50S ribosomal protein L11 methyltransferase [Bacteroidota bacterium]
MSHLEFQFKITPLKPWTEILIAYLSEIDFNGFYEVDGILKAFISSTDFDELVFSSLLGSLEGEDVEISYEKLEIENRNWNASWEANFDPVEIAQQLYIRAPFHEQKENFNSTIIIQPKMSFGTGHHQTTFLMCEAILRLDLVDKKVLDMGTGTGVLAILSEKKGSKDITAIDIEEWSIENCEENIVLNECTFIDTICGDVNLIDGKKFDVILANINKNILKKHLPKYFDSIYENGLLYLSGFFSTDVSELKTLANQVGFKVISTTVKDEWAILILQK